MGRSAESWLFSPKRQDRVGTGQGLLSFTEHLLSTYWGQGPEIEWKMRVLPKALSCP